MNFMSHSLRTPMCRLAVAVATISISSVAAAETIQQVSATQTNAQITELNIDFANAPIKPVAYQLDSPTRLVLDFPNTASGLARLTLLNTGNVKDVTTLVNDTTTRLIVTLNQSGQYTTRVQGNRLVVAIQNNAPAVANQVNIAPVVTPVVMPVTNTIVTTSTDTPAVVTAPVVTPTVSDTVVNTVVVDTPVAEKPAETMVVKVNPLLNPAAATGANHQYNYDGVRSITPHTTATGGSVVIGLMNDSVPLDVQRAGDELVVRFTGATVPKHLMRQLNAGGGLIKTITATNQGRNGVIRIGMAGDYEYKAYQMGGQLNISIEPPKRIRQPTLTERTYSGAPLSMDIQDMPVRNVLNMIAGQTNTNIVASDTVTGNITLRLIDVPWDQALDIILKSKNLDKRSNGKIIWIAPTDELVGQETKELEALNKLKELAPLRTEFIRLNYAKAADVLTLIQAQNSRSSGRSYDTTSILSPRGTVTIDPRTNTLIIKDTSESIASVRDLISKIDIPVKQVMIEARIVSATDNFSKSMGVKWGILSQGAATNRSLLVGGSETTINDLRKYSINTQTVNGQSVSYPAYTITTPNNLNVNLGATNPAGSIAFGLLSMSDLMIDLELSAMQADGKGEVISTPKVLTADKQTAKVMSGTQIAYQQATASGATSTSWVEAALSLEVTPNITPEGRIGMQLNIENGTPTSAPDGSNAISKDAIKTNVIVDDGQTVVLGGIFKNTLGNNVTKVPFLGDLPYVGNLFKKTEKNNNKQELLIFITPKLVPDSVNHIN